MGGFLGKMFPSLFSDPAEEALKRKMRINSVLRMYDSEVKRQDGFIKKYLNQAAAYKRVDDMSSYASAKKLLAFSLTSRKRVQHMLNTLQLLTTRADQMEGYRKFCQSVADITMSMGNAISAKDVVNAQMQLQKGMETAKSTDALMDQVLSTFESSFADVTSGEEDSLGVKDADLDKMISDMVGKKDTLAEDNIAALLNGTAN